MDAIVKVLPVKRGSGNENRKEECQENETVSRDQCPAACLPRFGTRIRDSARHIEIVARSGCANKLERSLQNRRSSGPRDGDWSGLCAAPRGGR